MKDETITIIATLPIYKQFRRENYNYKRKINKILKSVNSGIKGAKSPKIEELNQFIFCSVETTSDSLLSIEERKSLETRFQSNYGEFASKTLDKIKIPQVPTNKPV